MVAQLPIAKVVGLLIKTLAKPLSKRIQKNVSQYSIGRKMLINIGQLSHNITSRLTIYSAGYRVKTIRPLEEPAALSNGSEVFGEAFILMVSGIIVVSEYTRSKEKEMKKEEKLLEQKKDEKQAWQAKLDYMDTRIKALEQSYSDLQEEISQQKEKELSSLLNSVLSEAITKTTTTHNSGIKDSIVQQGNEVEEGNDSSTKKSSSWLRWPW